jgi:predicted transcriptional regulator
MGARLDTATRQKVDNLATRFHQPRAAILCQIIHGDLSHEQLEPLDQGEAPGLVCHLHLYVPSELHEQVPKAATAAELKTAPWLRTMARQVTIQDFPTSEQEATPRERSHDSRTHTDHFMLRLDQPIREKLEDLSTHFNKPASEIIRHLIAQATPEGFPKSWHIKVSDAVHDSPDDSHSSPAFDKSPQSPTLHT